MPTTSLLWDVKSLIERYASIDVVSKATVHGVLEYHSNCPFCGGTDRFITRPETGQFTCATRSSGCGKHGDAYDFLKLYCNMSHSEALETLGLENNADFVPATPSKSQQNDKEQPPCKAWQETGKLLVERAQRCLWTPAGKDMLSYLHSRGLGDEIIKKKKLGYIPLMKNGDYYADSLEHWGLDPEQVSKDRVRVPNGILIPWFEGDRLWRLAYKRPNPPKGQNAYGQVLGSGEGLYNVDLIQYDFPAIMVEGELCALSVEQEAGDLIACVATGSCTRARLSAWVAELNLASYTLQSFDEDEKGDSGAEYWLEALKGKCQRWSPYVAKDPNDILLKKFLPDRWECTLREWIEAGIATQCTLPFVLPSQVGGIELAATPLAGGESPLEKLHLKHWTQKEKQFVEDSFSRAKWHGPETDMKALTIKENLHANFEPMAFLNSRCPCGCGRFGMKR